MTITHHEAQRHRRKSGELSELDEMIEDESDAPLDICRRGERSELVRKALNRLEPRDRELLTSLVQEPPPSYDELAARLGMAVGSIGATRARCFKKLEAILMEMDSAPYC